MTVTGKDDRPFDVILQFPHVAGPRVIAQGFQGLVGNCRDRNVVRLGVDTVGNMKTRLIIDVLSSIALPILAFGQDKEDPGKASDAVKNPPALSPDATRDVTPAAPGDREPGKSSDAVRRAGS